MALINFIITVILLVFISACSSPPDELEFKGRINDYIGMLDADEVSKLESMLKNHEIHTCHQVGVVIVATTEGEPIEEFSLRTANRWELGHKGIDDGILLVLAVTDKRVRIEVGKGLTEYLTDVDASNIIENNMLPNFRSGNYGYGITSGLESIVNFTSKYEVPSKLRPKICARA